MNTKQREQLLLMLMPPTLVLATYLLFFYVPQSRTYREHSEQLDTKRNVEVTKDQALAAKTTLELAQKKYNELKVRLQNSRDELQQICLGFGSTEHQFGVAAAITRLLNKHSVVMVSQNIVRDPKLSQTHQSALQRISRYNGRSLEYRHYRLLGSYQALQAVLKELGKTQAYAFPASVTLDSSKASNGVYAWGVQHRDGRILDQDARRCGGGTADIIVATASTIVSSFASKSATFRPSSDDTITR